MQQAFEEDREFANYSDQLDAFVKHMSWPQRSTAEKGNSLPDPSKNEFLRGLQAVVELYFYGLPTDTV